MNVLGSLGLGVLLTALVVTGAMALAQEQGQRMHGTMGQQTDQPKTYAATSADSSIASTTSG